MFKRFIALAVTLFKLPKMKRYAVLYTDGADTYIFARNKDDADWLIKASASMMEREAVIEQVVQSAVSLVKNGK
jgi:hypothetical protein